MAIITFSPLVVAISGKVKDTVFSIWKGRPYIRARVTPSNPQTPAQVKQRAISTAGVTLWQNMHADLVVAWNAYASPYSVSGYNASQKRNTSTAPPNGDDTYARVEVAATQAIALMQATPGGQPINAFFAVGGAADTINVTWTSGDWTDPDAMYVAAFPEDTLVYYGAPYIPIQKVLATAGTCTVTPLAGGDFYTLVAIAYDDSEEAWSAAVVSKGIAAGT